MKEGEKHIFEVLNPLFPTFIPPITNQDLRDRYARVEIRASTPLVVFRESVAFESTSPEQTDRPPQLSLPPWSEEEGTRGGGIEAWSVPIVSPTC